MEYLIEPSLQGLSLQSRKIKLDYRYLASPKPAMTNKEMDR
jgi:hypothetical protein